MFSNYLMIIAVVIFVLTYIGILTEKVNRTVITFLGAVVMVVLGVISEEMAIEAVDFNTIGLLIGMMIIVNILKRTGIFQYIAIKMAKYAKGDPWKIILFFAIITAISSAFLDNVTTILLIAPVTFVITDTLKVNPIPFLITEILAANIGGTATLIGDPPNIMIGGQTNLGFLDFLINLGPVILVIFIIVMFLLKIVYRKSLYVKEENKLKVMKFEESKTIKDKSLLIKCLIVLGITIFGFTLHEVIGINSAIVALFGAAILLAISKVEVEEVLLEIEWPTIFFFFALFILVGGLEEQHIIDNLAQSMFHFTKGDMFLTAVLILWISAIASSFLDNIPFVSVMIPLIKGFAELQNNGAVPVNITPLWWALALGACLGGNGTLIGASANVIVGGMLDKNGYKLSFLKYMKVGFPIMIISVIISMIYLVIFYL